MQKIDTLNNTLINNPTAVCFGNFDGLHLGHQFLISELKEHAKALGVKSVICTFEPHPLAYYGRDLRFINTPRKRMELFEKTEVDYLVYAPFEGLASLTPEEFFVEIVIKFLKAKVIVVGEDYKFGHARAGNIDVLKELGDKYNVQCVFVKKLSDDTGYISSSRIRSEIDTGHVKDVNKLLDRCYSIDGKVVHGDGKGKDFGFPTINIDTANDIVPTIGGYATKVLIDSKYYNAMTYIGTRPTVDGKDMRIETNIFDFNEEIYGKNVEVFFIEKISEEEKFKSIEALCQRLRETEIIARELLANVTIHGEV